MFLESPDILKKSILLILRTTKYVNDRTHKSA